MIFDTASMYFRAFHGLPSSLRSPQGEPVNAVRGLLDAMARLVEQYRPTHLACAWDDDWRPQWRVDLVPSYKTHRLAAATPGPDGTAEEAPEELSVQVPVIRQVLAALGITVVGAAEHEADDVIGSLTAQFAGQSLAVTGDRDLFQLATGSTRVVYIGKGVAKHDLVDSDWVLAKQGVPAERYVDHAVLRGDPSDGLPGVKGIGEKTAAKLVGSHSSLEAMVQAAREQEPSMAAGLRSRLLEAEDYLAPARTVVQVVRDLDLDCLRDDARVLRIDASARDEQALAALVERWGISSSVGRMVAALDQAEGLSGDR